MSDSEGPFAFIRADSRATIPCPTFVSFVCFVGNNPNPCPSEQSVVNPFGVVAPLDDVRAGMGAHKARSEVAKGPRPSVLNRHLEYCNFGRVSG